MCVHNLTNFNDYKVLSQLFNTASVNDGSSLTSEFKYLNLVDTNTGASLSFDYVNGIILDNSLPPDRHISSEYLLLYNKTEKAIIEELEVKYTDLKAISLTLTEEASFYILMNLIERIEKRFEQEIIEQPEGRYYASVFNNLGQLRKFQYDLALETGLRLFPDEYNAEWFDRAETQAFLAFKHCIKLLLPRNLTQPSYTNPAAFNGPDLQLLLNETYRVSHFQAKTLSSAYFSISGILAFRYNRIHRYFDEHPQISDKEYDNLRHLQEKLYALLMQYYLISAAFGSRVAESYATYLDPWAQLCDNMIIDLFSYYCR